MIPATPYNFTYRKVCDLLNCTPAGRINARKRAIGFRSEIFQRIFLSHLEYLILFLIGVWIWIVIFSYPHQQFSYFNFFLMHKVEAAQQYLCSSDRPGHMIKCLVTLTIRPNDLTMPDYRVKWFSFTFPFSLSDMQVYTFAAQSNKMITNFLRSKSSIATWNCWINISAV